VSLPSEDDRKRLRNTLRLPHWTCKFTPAAGRMAVPTVGRQVASIASRARETAAEPSMRKLAAYDPMS
jgi:hypothetical protein